MLRVSRTLALISCEIDGKNRNEHCDTNRLQRKILENVFVSAKNSITVKCFLLGSVAESAIFVVEMIRQLLLWEAEERERFWKDKDDDDKSFVITICLGGIIGACVSGASAGVGFRKNLKLY